MSFHRPRVFRSPEGCCICQAKSSSSRFTDSEKYKGDSKQCFKLIEERDGDICNACVLLVKRFRKLPKSSTQNWAHVVGSRAGPGVKAGIRRQRPETPKKCKHTYRRKQKQKLGASAAVSPSQQPDSPMSNIDSPMLNIDSPMSNLSEDMSVSDSSRPNTPVCSGSISNTPVCSGSISNTSVYSGSRSNTSVYSGSRSNTPVCSGSRPNTPGFRGSRSKPSVHRPRSLGLPQESSTCGFFDPSMWKREETCCGPLFRGPFGEVMMDLRHYQPCSAVGSSLSAGGHTAKTVKHSGVTSHHNPRRNLPSSSTPSQSHSSATPQIPFSSFSRLSATPPPLSNAPSHSSMTPSLLSARPLNLSTTTAQISTTPSNIATTTRYLSDGITHIFAKPSHLYATPSHISSPPARLSVTPSLLSTTSSHLSTTHTHFSALPSYLSASPSHLSTAPFLASATPSYLSAMSSSASHTNSYSSPYGDAMNRSASTLLSASTPPLLSTLETLIESELKALDEKSEISVTDEEGEEECIDFYCSETISDLKTANSGCGREEVWHHSGCGREEVDEGFFDKPCRQGTSVRSILLDSPTKLQSL